MIKTTIPEREFKNIAGALYGPCATAALEVLEAECIDAEAAFHAVEALLAAENVLRSNATSGRGDGYIAISFEAGVPGFTAEFRVWSEARPRLLRTLAILDSLCMEASSQGRGQRSLRLRIAA